MPSFFTFQNLIFFPLIGDIFFICMWFYEQKWFAVIVQYIKFSLMKKNYSPPEQSLIELL